MARKKRRTRTTPAVPPPRAEPRRRPTTAPEPGPAVSLPSTDDDLAVTYQHVRRDLMRIAVIAVVMFATIIASQFFLG